MYSSTLAIDLPSLNLGCTLHHGRINLHCQTQLLTHLKFIEKEELPHGNSSKTDWIDALKMSTESLQQFASFYPF